MFSLSIVYRLVRVEKYINHGRNTCLWQLICISMHVPDYGVSLAPAN